MAPVNSTPSKALFNALSCHLMALCLLGGTFYASFAHSQDLKLKEKCESLLGDRSIFRLTRPEDSRLTRLGKRSIEHLVGLSKLLSLYEKKHLDVNSPESFWNVVLKSLNISLNPIGELENIPSSGPLVVVANHPFGFLDGVALAHLLSQRRDDYMILGNAMLSQVPEIESRIFPVQILSGKQDKKATKIYNQQSIENAKNHLKNGGALIIFPSGTVGSTNEGFLGLSGPAKEAQWRDTVGKLIKETQALSLPVYFDGKNSLLFHLASKFNKKTRELLRVALLPSELLKKINKNIDVVIGRPIPAIKLQIEPSITQALKHEVIKLSLHKDLKNEEIVKPRTLSPLGRKLPLKQRSELLSSLIKENKALLYSEKDELKVYKVAGKNLPQKLLRHLGILREQTFRAVGEGSGKPSDFDQFDLRYEHLLMWSDEKKDFIGAYRLGSYKEARKTQNYSLMYTHDQFQYSPSFFRQFNGEMLEMGRSFIVSKSQNDPRALSLLWSGIGEHLLRNKEFRYLCGPVSLSGEYTDLSKTLIKNYYMKSHGDSKNLKQFLNPKTLFPSEIQISPDVMDDFMAKIKRPADLDKIIKMIEPDGKGIPPLVKHYPGLMNAQFIEASFDPDFNTLDFFICVDLKEMNPAKAKNFIGDKAYDLQGRFTEK